ncbi:hypothetical protein V6N13_028210 [Hibiscus sabdariffa]|uniref:Uncharacterized protein n=1 Tax=Hibiscus sabdariffa TaxID=183260 RepID=A0ABR2DBZ8_9ROSI
MDDEWWEGIYDSEGGVGVNDTPHPKHVPTSGNVVPSSSGIEEALEKSYYDVLKGTCPPSVNAQRSLNIPSCSTSNPKILSEREFALQYRKRFEEASKFLLSYGSLYIQEEAYGLKRKNPHLEDRE